MTWYTLWGIRAGQWRRAMVWHDADDLAAEGRINAWAQQRLGQVPERFVVRACGRAESARLQTSYDRAMARQRLDARKDRRRASHS